MTSPLADVDPVAIVVAALKASPVVAALFGGPDHVSALNEPPYPHLLVAASPDGDAGRLVWSVTSEVIVQAWGEMDGRPGRAVLRRGLVAVMAELCDLPSREWVGGPVVVDVVTTRAPGWAPDAASGQPCWRWSLFLTAHPPSGT